ncbi:MAG: phosphopyruvate hydratase [Microbacteriaceae bacterium]
MNDYISNHHATSHHPNEYVTHGPDRSISPIALRATSILDSRGYPTVHVELELDDGTLVSGSAPAGASTGEYEAVELRDGGTASGGKGVEKALAGLRNEVAPLLVSRSWSSISEIDKALRALDGTPNYARLGANAIVATSIAAARAFAARAELPLHRWISHVTGSAERLPVPHFNVLNGGAHAANALDFQEFMIAPVCASSEAEAVRIGAEVYHALKGIVQSRYGTSGLGDEGGFAPPIANPEEALTLLVEAIEAAGFIPGIDQVAIALDPAANGFQSTPGNYEIAGHPYDHTALVDYYEHLVNTFPIRSIEDGFAEDDHEGWTLMAARLGERIQLVGDDLYVTDAARILDGAEKGYSNAELIKPNQIGTVSQTFDAIATARSQAMACMISHRSGETGDTFIADLAVGTGVGQIKSGAPARGERVAKYNRMTAIEQANPGLSYGLASTGA